MTFTNPTEHRGGWDVRFMGNYPHIRISQIEVEGEKWWAFFIDPDETHESWETIGFVDKSLVDLMRMAADILEKTHGDLNEMVRDYHKFVQAVHRFEKRDQN